MSSLIDRPIKQIAFASLGLLIRFVTTVTFKDILRYRVEFVTPISDWKRAHEAIHLWNMGLDPYGGNLFHEYPISLQFYKLIFNYFNVDLAFCLTDIITALLIHKSIFRQLITEGETNAVASKYSSIVYLLYLFSPLTILSCAGQSTTIFTNFLFAVISFTLSIREFRVLTCVLCALMGCNNIHYASLILPIFVCMEYSSRSNHHVKHNKTDIKLAASVSGGETDASSARLGHRYHHQTVDGGDVSERNHGNAHYYSSSTFLSSLANSALICLVSMATLVATSYILMGNSWSFLHSSYVYVLRIGDLSPNIGMHWYFFIEMFDHFLSFFIWTVQIIAFIQAIPLTIALRDRPFFALFMVALLTTICQPYPSLANFGLVSSMLPRYASLFEHLAQGLKVACACVTCMCLWPIFWHLWIVMGTANANFYFGATLAFMAALIFFSVDLLNAHMFIMTKLKLEQFDATERKIGRTSKVTPTASQPKSQRVGASTDDSSS